MPFRKLFRVVEKTLSTLPFTEDIKENVIQSAMVILRDLKNELGLQSARIYQRIGNKYKIIEVLGDHKDIPSGFTLPANYFPIEQTLENGISVMDLNTPGVNKDIEKSLGISQFAAISIADGQFLIGFSFREGAEKEEIYQGLNVLRHTINFRLREEQTKKIITEAKKIQESILPRKNPSFPGFEIYGISSPAEVVGGDYYDFIWVSNNILGLSIADATGHGLPAALQVRDVYMGLRMGSTREFKIIQIIERLNKLVNREKLTSRFISLFYGELENNGVLIYINAGHNPPVLLKKRKVEYLSEGGPVLGPLPDATYQRGVTRIDPKDILILYTDGLVESRNFEGREFGLERLISIARKHSRSSAERIAKSIVKAEKEWRSENPQEDDITLVVVKRL
ncbi:MAG: PP2C family protein-serine/threonine phosphatase [Thermoanaerobaculia bacterium]